MAKRDKGLKTTFEILSLLLVLGAIVSCLEFNEMDNTLEIAELFAISALVGIAIASCCIWGLLLTFKRKSVSKSLHELCGALFIGLFVGCPAMANFYNRSVPVDEICSSYEILSMDYNHGRWGRSHHLIYITVDGTEERVRASHDSYHKLEGLEHVRVCIAKGRLSFEHISGVDIVE